MRELKRIKPIMKALTKIWEQHPELRLGQLLINVSMSEKDLYYLEDYPLLGRAEDKYDKK